MIGVTNVQVNDTVYKLTQSKITLLVGVTDEKCNEVEWELVANSYTTNHFKDEQEHTQFVKASQGYESFQNGKKLALKDYNRMNIIIEAVDSTKSSVCQRLKLLALELTDYFEIKTTRGIYEMVEKWSLFNVNLIQILNPYLFQYKQIQEQREG